jgi:hypothetical protein
MIDLSSFIAFDVRHRPDRRATGYRDEDTFHAAFEYRVCRVAGWLGSRNIGARRVTAMNLPGNASFIAGLTRDAHGGLHEAPSSRGNGS